MSLFNGIRVRVGEYSQPGAGNTTDDSVSTSAGEKNPEDSFAMCDADNILDFVSRPECLLSYVKQSLFGIGVSSKSDDEDQPQSACLIFGLGMLRLISSRNGREYEATLIFPNLNEVTMTLELNSDGTIEVKNDGQGTYKNVANGRVRPVQVRKVEGYAGRVEVELPEQDVPLQVDVTFAEPRRGDASGRRLELSPNQPEHTGDADFFTRKTGSPRMRRIGLRHSEIVSDTGLAGSRGGIRTWKLLLTNGDQIELTIWSDHAGKGKLEAKSATLKPFNPDGSSEQIKLDVSRNGTKGSPVVNISGAGYDISVPFIIRGGSHGSASIVEGDVEVAFTVELPPRPESAPVESVAPAAIADPKAAAGVALPAEKVEDVYKEVLLIPETEGVRELNRAAWFVPTELKFVGKIGDMTVSGESPLVIRGVLQDGRFMPDLGGKDQVQRVVNARHADGRLERLEITLQKSSNRYGFSLQISCPSGGKVEIEPQFFGRVFGFGTQGVPVEQNLKGLYDITELSAVEFDKSGTFVPASDEVRQEVARWLTRKSTAWESDSFLTVSEADPSVVRVELSRGDVLYFMREENSTEVEYRLLCQSDAGKQFSLLGVTESSEAGAGIDGIAIESPKGAHVVTPWRGSWVQITGDSQSVVYRNAEVAGVVAQVRSTEDGRRNVAFVLDKDAPNTSLKGSFTDVHINGNNSAVFELENGQVMLVDFPDTTKIADGLMMIALGGQDYAVEEPLNVSILDSRNVTSFSGQLLFENGEWVIRSGDGVKWAVEVDYDSAPVPLIRLMEPPKEVYELPTQAAEQLELAEQTAARAPAIEVAGIQPAERRFPWEDGTFLLPSEQTRIAMRSAAIQAERPAEGARTVFTFYGRPQGDVSARRIADSMRRFGTRSLKFFEWQMDVDMVFKNGSWVPDTNGELNVARRFPSLDGLGRTTGFFTVSTWGGKFPVRLTSIGTGWGLMVGPDRVVQSFRETVQYQGATEIIPDFGLSLGEPTGAAKGQYQTLAGIELARGLLKPAHFLGRREAPIDVDAVVADNVSSRITPTFGDPIYRGSTMVNGNVAIVELSPGYSSYLPDARFSRLQVYDGNGFNLNLVFQHMPDGSTVPIACESLGKKIELDQLNLNTQSGASSEVSGLLPAKYRFAGGGHHVGGIPFAIRWHQDSGVFSVDSVDFDQSRLTLEGMRFRAEGWTVEEIMRGREGTELQIVTNVVGERGPSKYPNRRWFSSLASSEEAIMLPDNRTALARGKTAIGEALPVQLQVGFQYSHDGVADELKIPMTYNSKRGTYVPPHENGFILVTINGNSVPVQIKSSRTGKGWQINLPVGEGKTITLNLGNYYVSDTGADGRGVPVAWTSARKAADYGLVRRYLEMQGVVEGPLAVQAIDGTQSVVSIPVGDKTYNLPIKLHKQPGGPSILAVTGPGQCADADGTRDIPLRYYMAHFGAPPVVEIDGHVFELRLAERAQPIVYVRETNAGAEGLNIDSRMRSSVRLEAGDQSAQILMDLNATSFVEEVNAALEHPDESRLARRIVEDVISDKTYELVFEVSRDSIGKPELSLVGIADVSGTNAAPISAEVLHQNGKIYVRLPDGQSFSVSQTPSRRVQVTSYGKVMDRTLIRLPWSTVSSEPELFSKPVAAQGPALSYYQVPENRIGARLVVGEELGIESDVLWDVSRSYPKGLIFTRQEWDPLQPKRRVYQRGSFEMECDLTKSGRGIASFKVTYDLGDGNKMDVPSTVMYHQGRPYIGLGGPFKGVVLYMDALSGIPNIREISHPAVREQLERDLGKTPIPRPYFKPDADGSMYKYPEVEGELAEAVESQVRMTRLWRLEKEGVLPAKEQDRQKIAELLIPDSASYSGGGKTPLLTTFENMSNSGSAAMKAAVSRSLVLLASGERVVGDFSGITELWNGLDAMTPVSADYEVAQGMLFEEFTRVQAKGFQHVEAPKPPVVSTREEVSQAKLGGDLSDVVRMVYGETYADGIEMSGAVTFTTLEELAGRLRSQLGEKLWEEVHTRISASEFLRSAGVLAEVAVSLEVLSSVQDPWSYKTDESNKRIVDFVELTGSLLVDTGLTLPVSTDVRPHVGPIVADVNGRMVFEGIFLRALSELIGFDVGDALSLVSENASSVAEAFQVWRQGKGEGYSVTEKPADALTFADLVGERLTGPVAGAEMTLTPEALTSGLLGGDKTVTPYVLKAAGVVDKVELVDLARLPAVLEVERAAERLRLERERVEKR